MALTALLQGTKLGSRRAKWALVTLGVLGASLFYGDGMITPAISVLSAVEGLKVATPALVSLRAADHRRGDHRPVRDPATRDRRHGPPLRADHGTVVHGPRDARRRRSIAEHPAILRALSPTYGIAFFVGSRRRRLHRARLGGPGRDRRRGTLCRHGPLRPPADQPGLVRLRLPGADTQLPRAGRPDPRARPARSPTPSTCSRPDGRGCRW